MAKTQSKAFSNYVFAWLCGTVIVILGIPVWQAFYTRSVLVKVDWLLISDEPKSAAREVRRVRPWARNFPHLARRVSCTAIRTHVANGDIRKATAVAEEMVTRGSPPLAPTGWDDIVRGFTGPTVDALLTLADPHAKTSTWSGYETLIAELLAHGKWDELKAMADDLCQRFPAAPFAPELHRFCKNPPPLPQPRVVDTPTPQPTDVADPDDKTPRVIAAYATPRRQPPRRQPTVRTQPRTPRVYKTPTTNPAGALASEPGTRWGVVHVYGARAYDKTGKFIGRLEPGSLASISAVHKSNKAGELAVSSVLVEGKIRRGVLLRIDELDVVSGSLARASASEIDLRMQRASLLAELAVRKKELAFRNPHARAYSEAKAAYKTFFKDVEDLTAKRDAATGSKRVDYGNKLQKMKNEGAELERAASAAKTKYHDWKRRHGDGSAGDTRTASLSADLATLERQLEANARTP